MKKKKVYENNVEKGEIAQNEQFHLFLQCFLCNQCLKILITPSQTTNFRLFQTERICRRHKNG